MTQRDALGNVEGVTSAAFLPRTRTSSRVQNLYEVIRRQIIHGELLPGTRLSQVQLAAELGVSRAKLREALRMLQNEGLIEAEDFQRNRVAEVNPEALEGLYASRIVLESLAALVSIPRLSAEERAQLEQAHADMAVAWDAGDLAAWEEHHSTFHLSLVQHVTPALRTQIETNAHHSERYRAIYVTRASREDPARSVGMAEHAALLRTALDGDADGVARTLATHYARVATISGAILAPAYDLRAVRAALQLVHRAPHE